MEFTGRCYCGDIQYSASGDPAIKLQCHCRECQYISGGNANVTIGMPDDGFKYTKGSPKQFQRSDIENGVVRDFCGHGLGRVFHAPPNVLHYGRRGTGAVLEPGMFSAPLISSGTVLSAPGMCLAKPWRPRRSAVAQKSQARR